MEKRNMTKFILAACSVFLAVGLLSTLALADEINIWIEPNMISLNANSDSNGDPETIASFGCYLTGQRITDSYVEFMIGGDVVATSTDMRVTRMGACQAYFDRADIQKYALDKGLEGDVAVTVSGFYRFEPIGGGDPYGPVRFTGDSAVFFR